MLYDLTSVTSDLPSRRLLDDLTLTLPKGRVTALIGRNGSGKSSLLRLLSGQTRPTRGTITFQGRDLAAWAPRDLARALACLPQVTPPTDGMTLSELVTLGRYPWRGALGRMRSDDHAAVDQALTACGVEPLRHRLVETLSGGERQRGWIAMMLAQGAQTLLLDEPISALDVAHGVEVLTLVQSMSRERGLSAVIVLHDINMALRFCDHVVALEGGRLIHEGGIETLADAATLGRIYGLPMTLGHSAHPFALPA